VLWKEEIDLWRRVVYKVGLTNTNSSSSIFLHCPKLLDKFLLLYKEIWEGSAAISLKRKGKFSSYLRKSAYIYSYMRKSCLLYEFAPNPFKISIFFNRVSEEYSKISLANFHSLKKYCCSMKRLSHEFTLS